MARPTLIGIYNFVNKINGKRYVGQSNNILKREKDHRTDLTKRRDENKHFINAWHKYGEDNFEFSILEECGLLDLNDRERYWIAFYHSNDPNYGYNKTSGGQDLFKKTITDEEREKLSRCGDESINHVLTEQQVREIIVRLINGEYCTDISKDYNVRAGTIASVKRHQTWKFLTEGIYFPKVKSKCGVQKTKQVDMYRLDGTFVCTFSSMKKAAQAVGQKDISSICQGRGISCHGYTFRYHGHSFSEFTTRKLASKLQSIDQYDLNWNFIQSFDSITDANKYFGNSRGIGRALKDYKYTVYGFHWLRHGESIPEVIDDGYRLDKYDLDWNYICSYKTSYDAAKDINKDPSTINHIINNPRKTAGGYHWFRHGELPPKEINDDNLNWKPVCQYDTKWNLIAEYKSVKQAGAKTNLHPTLISSVLHKRLKTAGGYCWLYKGEQPPEEDVVNLSYVAVDKYDLDWNYLVTYDCVRDAARDVGISSTAIGCALKGRSIKAGGYYWLYKGETPPIDGARTNKHFSPVDQYDKDWNFIASYPMTKIASQETGACESTIRGVILGKYKFAGGFHWLRHGEQPPVNQKE